MCGIAGIITHHEKAGELILRMTERLHHRGPDAQGTFIHENTALGHRRLSILDLSDASNQPFYSDDGRYAMVYNGEVYNYRELQQQYLPGEQMQTRSDTEVILKLFIRNGPEFVRLLNGMFAIAIYDKAEKTTWIFRDRLGIKPIYYYQQNTTIAFASELKSIQALSSDINLEPDATAIRNYLHLGYIPEPHSIYQAVKKFPSGHYAKIADSTLSLYTYWKAGDHLKSETLKNAAQAEEELDRLLHQSVEYRLISDVPFGTFLSGGIDSSTITAIAAQKTQKLKTFSIAFEDKKHNEAHFAAKVAGYLQTAHTQFTVTEKEAREWIPELINIYDEPFADSSAIPSLMVSKMAREHVKMVLTGDGGDEQFMGYGTYQWARRLSNPFWYYNRKWVAAILHRGNLQQQRAAKVFMAPGKKELYSHIFSQEQYLFSQHEIARLLLPQWKNAALIKPEFPAQRALSPAEKQSWFDLNYYLKDDLLVKVDRASMHFGLEARVPLLDHRIVEWSMNLDESLKYRNGVSKYTLKQVLYRYLPEEYFNRPKWGFSVPLDKWLSHELKDFLTDHLSEQRIKHAGIVDHRQVSKLMNDYFNGKTYLYNRLWALLILHLFLEK